MLSRLSELHDTCPKARVCLALIMFKLCVILPLGTKTGEISEN